MPGTRFDGAMATCSDSWKKSLRENLGLAQVADVSAGSELAMGASAAGMHDAFRNTLTVETLQFL